MNYSAGAVCNQFFFSTLNSYPDSHCYARIMFTKSYNKGNAGQCELTNECEKKKPNHATVKKFK